MRAISPSVRRAIGISTLLLAPFVWAAQPLETETARFLDPGQWQFEGATEYQTSSEGKEFATPLAFEYGISDRFQILVEPVPYTSIRPKIGSNASGAGDVEATLFGMIRKEDENWPALAWAAEVKLPTARNERIGSGKTDFTAFLIASKRFGAIDLSANLGYSILGQPNGVKLKNTVNAALAAEYLVDEHWDLIAEVLATSASVRNPGANMGGENSTTPEFGGSEVVGTVGFRYRINPRTVVSLGVSYDKNNATLIRPGITVLF